MKIVKVTNGGRTTWLMRHWLRWYVSFNEGTDWKPLLEEQP